MLADLIVRVIRTWVPIGIGWLVSFLALPADTAVQVAASITAAVIAAYYVLAAELEEHVHPVFGWLLGIPKDRTKA